MNNKCSKMKRTLLTNLQKFRKFKKNSKRTFYRKIGHEESWRKI